MKSMLAYFLCYLAYLFAHGGYMSAHFYMTAVIDFTDIQAYYNECQTVSQTKKILASLAYTLFTLLMLFDVLIIASVILVKDK